MAEYLVTGGAGFIGSNIVEYLLKQGQSVRVLDNFLTGKRENIASFKDKIEFVEGDLRDFAAVQRACAGVRFVIHQAAVPSVPRSVAEPQFCNEVNVTGTLNMLVAARDAKAERFVFASSSSIYGESPELPKREDMRPSPISPYGLQKLTGEYYCKLFWELYGFPTVALRYFNVFGPRQDPQSEYAAVIPRFITMILQEQAPTIFGDGTQSRDFSYVQNVVDANLAACRASKVALGNAYNVACNSRTSLLEFVELTNQIIGTNIKAKHAPKRSGDILHSQADMAAAARDLNYKPAIDFRRGLELTIAWYRQKLAQKA
jgi:nucleoside-diphosphate-sugar epimerase